MVKRKNYLLNPISRQNFADALAENHNLKLEVCRIELLGQLKKDRPKECVCEPHSVRGDGGL